MLLARARCVGRALPPFVDALHAPTAPRRSFASSGGDGDADASFLAKCRGVAGAAPTPAPAAGELAKSGALTFAGVGGLAALHCALNDGALTLMLGSFGASACLIYARARRPP